MIERILPAAVATVETRSDRRAELFAAERQAVAMAVAGRRREFATARACAREALARLGEPPTPIPVGADGEPRWPPGLVGSITHCRGFRAAAVAHRDRVAAIGIDAEPDRPLPSGVVGAIAGAEERRRLAHLPADPSAPAWDRLLFSAKEAVFKAWFPLTGRKLGFDDALVELEPGGGFAAHLRTDDASLSGRWLAREGLLVTGICLLPGRSLQSAAITNRAGERNGDEEQIERHRASGGGAARITEDG